MAAIQLLVTDDHAFYKEFVQTELAEKVLRSEVKEILGIRKAMHVKLAGEMILGCKFSKVCQDALR